MLNQSHSEGTPDLSSMCSLVFSPLLVSGGNGQLHIRQACNPVMATRKARTINSLARNYNIFSPVKESYQGCSGQPFVQN